LLLFACATAAAHAQTAIPTVPPVKPRPARQASAYNPNIVLLDPAHGGSDLGARLGDDNLEKDATVAFAGRLKTALAAHGFTVLLTHDSAADELTPDQRAEAANRSRAAACLLLHASSGGHGVHLFTSSLPATASSSLFGSDEIKPVLPWGTAQSAVLAQSARLAGELADAVHAIRVPLVLGQSSVQPIDSLSCPAVALELAPLAPTEDGADPTPASDAEYQQRIAEAVAAALDSWRSHLTVQLGEQNPAPSPAKPPKPKPAPQPAPKPKVIPEETPDILSAPPPHKPAPIVRRPPENPPPGTPQ